MAVTYVTQEELDLMVEAITISVSPTRMELTVPAALAALLPGNLRARYMNSDLKGPVFNITLDPSSTIGWGRKIYPGDRKKLTALREHFSEPWGPETHTGPVHTVVNYDRRGGCLKVGMDRQRPAAPLRYDTPAVSAHEIRVVQTVDQMVAEGV